MSRPMAFQTWEGVGRNLGSKSWHRITAYAEDPSKISRRILPPDGGGPAWEATGWCKSLWLPTWSSSLVVVARRVCRDAAWH